MQNDIDKDVAAELRPYKEEAKRLCCTIAGYNLLGLGNIKITELPDLMGNPKKFLYAKIAGKKNLKIEGVEINPEKAFDIIKKPENADAFIDLVEANKVFSPLSCFTIKGDEVEVSVKTIQTIVDNAVKKSNAEGYETDMQKEARQHLENINNAFAFFRKLSYLRGPTIDDFLDKAFLNNNWGKGDMEPNPQFIKKIV